MLTAAALRPPAPRSRWVRRLGGLTLAGTAAVVGVVAGSAAWVHHSARGRIHPADQAPRRPVALVLGAGLEPDGRPSAFLRGRLDVAVDLYQRHVVQVVLVSGAGRSTGQDEPAAMRDYLLAAGIPERHIVPDPHGVNTRASCLRAQRVFGADRVLVVTQTYHLPRALALCQAIGLDAEGVGDRSVRRDRWRWLSGTVRELPANVKAAGNVLVRSDAVAEPVRPDLRQALTG